MNRIHYIILLLSIGIFLIGCSRTTDLNGILEKGNSNKIADMHITNEVITYSNHLDKIKQYNNLEDLYKNSEFVITGECISSTPFYQNEMLYTISVIEISNVLKGDLSLDKMIQIIEIGGRTTFGEYEKGCNLPYKAFETGKERLSADQEITIGTDGYFPVKDGDVILLFLCDTTGFIKDSTNRIFSILGSYDGKFYLDFDGNYKRPIPNSEDTISFSEDCLTININDVKSAH